MSKRIQERGISSERVATDDGNRFLSVFGEDQHEGGKAYTVGMEQLPTEAPGTEGLSEDLLFFEEAVKPSKGV